MLYLISQTLLCLAVATALGLFFGWLLGRWRERERAGQDFRVHADKLRNEFARLESGHGAAMERLDAAAGRIDRLTHDQSGLREGIEASRSTLAELGAAAGSLREQGDSLAARVNDESSRVDGILGQTGELERRAIDLGAGLLAGRERIEAVASVSEKDLAGLGERLESLARERVAEQTRLDELQARIDRADRRAQQSANLSAALDEKLGTLEERTTAADARVEQSLAEVRKLLQTVSANVETESELRQALDAMLHSARETLQAQQGRFDSLAHTFTAETQVRQKLQQNLDAVDRSIPALETRHEEARARDNELERRIGGVESALEALSAPDQLERLREELTAQTARNAEWLEQMQRRLDARLAARDEEIASLTDRLQQHEKSPHGAAAPAPVMQEADDLTRIWGVGKVLERRLNQLGIYSYSQIANLADAEIERVQEHLDTIPDRIRREGWISSARQLHTEKYGEHGTQSFNETHH